ncbi:MAG: sulfotransferase [Bacteroidales bacterium]
MSFGSRNNVFVKAGRIYQQIAPVFSFIDYIFWLRKRKHSASDPSAIFIIGPPRSGTTLTYQLLTAGFENIHLTNIWNLLYSTPVLGGMISERLCANHIASFKSRHGYVSGLCGEAEGLKFWKYWTGQGLTEDQTQLNPKRMKKLVKVLTDYIPSPGKIYIAGYIGHVFCMNFIRHYFPRALFIHVRRDLISNAYSIYRDFPNKYFSIRPKGIDVDTDCRYAQIAKQIIEVHFRVFEQWDEDVIPVHYEEVCRNPEKVIERINDFAEEQGILLKRKHNMPQNFHLNRTDAGYNEHSRALDIALANELRKLSFEDTKPFFEMISQ